MGKNPSFFLWLSLPYSKTNKERKDRVLSQNHGKEEKNVAILALRISSLAVVLVSHYSATGDTSSCDALGSAISLRGNFSLRCPLCKACLWIVIGHLYGNNWGCSSDSLRYHRKHSATGVLLHLCRDRGGGLFRSGH